MRGGHAKNVERDDMQQQQEEALANLATATVEDRQAVTALISSNATLTQELRTATATIAMLQLRLVSCSYATTPRTGARGQQRQQAIQQIQHNPGRDTMPLYPNRYCWSHGYLIRIVHNGASCYNTLPGHHRAATRADPMGGSTKKKMICKGGLGQSDKNYINLVNNKSQEQIKFNSICLYSPL